MGRANRLRAGTTRTAALRAYGVSFDALEPEDPVWPAGKTGPRKPLSAGTFYANFRRYLRAAGLPATGVHVLRHTAAKLRREASASVEEVGQFLDHTSLAVTTTYLRRLEGQRDQRRQAVAEMIGV